MEAGPVESPAIDVAMWEDRARLKAGRKQIYGTQLVKAADGSVSAAVVGFVPNVDQSFHGLFKSSSPPPGRTQPKCVKAKLPWQGKIRVVKNGVITKQVIK